MAHFAKVENGFVIDLIVIGNENCGGGNFPESEKNGQDFIASLAANDPRLEGKWYQTSYNTYNGLYYQNRMIELSYDEMGNLISSNGVPEGAFRNNFAQIGYVFDKNAGPHGEFYDPNNG